ncbi:retrotransposon protein, putative, ty1-copia subclass [Tanacetum coccineum]
MAMTSDTKADKNKQVVAYQPKPKQNPPQKKENPKKDQACHHCNVVGHWKRNCPLYLEELRTNKNKMTEHGAAASGVVSFSCLLDLGFVHTVTSNGIYVSLNGIFHFSAIPVNGVFEIDMNDNVSKYNNNSIFSINKKRKLDLNSSYLWHCRLAHIGKTRMQKLQREGLLESINDGSYDKCESCIYGKMTKKPFNNNIERATDLLGLIHTDVCGPLRHVSRKGKNGIVQHLTSPYTPQQNSVSKRRNRTLLDMVGKTPYEIWHGKVPNMSYLKVWVARHLGEAAYILGIKIYRDRSLRLIGLNQSAYIDKILKKFSMQNSKKGFIPMEVKHDLSNEMCASSDEEKAYMKKVPYASAVGSINDAVEISENTKDMFIIYGAEIQIAELDVRDRFCDASWQLAIKDDTKCSDGLCLSLSME